MKKRIYTGLIGALVLSCCAGCERKQPEVIWESYTEQDETAAEEAGLAADGAEILQAQAVMETQPQKIFVDICGAVQRPGVYELEAGMRVCDAVEAAGGLLGNADLASLNQAALLADAAKIYVYTQEEAAQQGISASEQSVTGGASGQESSAVAAKVNINTADIAQLCTLSGIGESRARDIIAYREANGGFQSPEEIMNVSGIKEATFQKIKDEIAVR